MSDFDSPNTGLLTIQNGEVPECRMKSASDTQDWVRRLWENDEKRASKRSKVQGLVGGFPPYKASKLRDAGRAEACNVNWNTAKQYTEAAIGGFYDLFSEAPGLVGIRTSHGMPEERIRYSQTMSEVADELFRGHKTWDFNFQLGIEQTVLFGCGPLFFEDAFSVVPRGMRYGDLKIEEDTQADTEYWDGCSIDMDYRPPQLFDFIRNPAAAKKVGWDVEFTKNVLENAMSLRDPDGQPYQWEYYERMLKSNSLSYYDESKVCRLAHVFWKEFSGRITHAIIERTSTTTTNTKYLFFHHERYKDWSEVIHPMYFDRGNGGWHHTVTGAGTLFYGALEYENRLMCRLMDGVFAPKVLFKPTSTESTQRMQLAHFGDYGVMSPGFELQQNPINGYINEGLTMYRASSDLMRSNLSSFRQQVEPQKPGNPETKFGRMLDAQAQSGMNNTTFSRYYKQLDFLYAEMVRRLCNINSPNPLAKKFQEECKLRGVPEECFGRIASVEAVRVVGEGNKLLRRSSLAQLGEIMPGLPEEGQNNWKNDVIAASCGQKSVQRYNPTKDKSKLPDDQQFFALVGVSMMKDGVHAIVTSSQNPVTYAGTYLTACVQSLQSLQQGGKPEEVMKFLDLCIPAVMAHLQRIAKDPLRQRVVQEISKQLEEIKSQASKLRKMIEAQQKKQQQQQQAQQQMMSDQAIAAAKLAGDERRKDAKLNAQLRRDEQKSRTQNAIADATAASNIHRQNRLAAFAE
jgi:hypothetical protein